MHVKLTKPKKKKKNGILRKFDIYELFGELISERRTCSIADLLEKKRKRHAQIFSPKGLSTKFDLRTSLMSLLILVCLNRFEKSLFSVSHIILTPLLYPTTFKYFIYMQNI